MRDTFKIFWLGLFLILSVIVIAWLILFIKPSFGDAAQEIKVRFANVEKISPGTQVSFAGRPVGKVKEIYMVPHPREAPADSLGDLYLYESVLEVDSSVQVYTYDEILVATEGLLGEKSIAIVPRVAPSGKPAAEDITDHLHYAKSSERIEKTLEGVTSAARSLEQGVASLCDFTERASTLIACFEEREIIDKMGAALVKTETLFHQIETSQLIDKMAMTFELLFALTSNVSNGEGTIGQLFCDESAYDRLMSVLCQFDLVLSDVRRFGLLYQFSGKWRMEQRMRKEREKNICYPLSYQKG